MNKTEKINSSLLKKLKPRDTRYDVWDATLKGFLIRVNPSGTMSYICQYARGRRVTIGRVNVISAAQAREQALKIISDWNHGIAPLAKKGKHKKKTLQDFIEQDYLPWATVHRKSADKSVQRIKRCFLKEFGDKALPEITAALIEKWRTNRLKHNISAETVNRDIATFKAAISKAVEWELIEKHPLARFKLLKSNHTPKVRYLDHDEEKRLRNALELREQRLRSERNSANKWRIERNYPPLPSSNANQFADYLTPMVLLSLNTGMRQGEVFQLTWEMVNLKAKLITIAGYVTKSGHARHIPLNKEAFSVLKTWCEQHDIKSGFVFKNQHSEAFYSVKKSWSNLLEHAKINNFRWHDMRHHFASRLVMAGVDLNTVRELLGHSDIKMTLRYAHLAPEHKARAVEKLVHLETTN